jgi:hypothetical protein
MLSNRGHKILLITRAGGAVERALGSSPIEQRIKALKPPSIIAAIIFIVKAFITGLKEASGYDIILSCDIACIPGLLIGNFEA